ncbi:mandelate racemase/muconate lactonizing enzyme family protein [Diaminobutyricibacter sp. McL0618]|uniref:mandelate racemase/muconate lactonizing enzyme family protein n=1 Tax=Leifsonia sp. McL0618 TaxID=3415677 RepID=UPI003CF24FE9
MQIVGVEAFVLKIPVAEPYLGKLPEPSDTGYFVRPPWQSLYSDRYESMLVRVIAEDGSEGWGEALAPVGPEITAAIVERLLAPMLTGRDATSPRSNWHFLRSLMRERGHLVGHQADALAAVDIALWDLCGRITGRSIADLLGGALRETIPTYVSGLPRPTHEARAALAAEWTERGTRRFKLHLGWGVNEDLAAFDAVRAAAPEAAIAVDAHWAYTVSDALALARGLEQRNAWFLEAPLAPEHLAGHTDLASRTQLPVAVGETLRNRYEFEAWLAGRALGIAQPDVGRTGITEAMAIAELCATHHVPVAPHHSTGLGISLAAGLHVSAAAVDLLAFEYQPTSVELGELRLGTHLHHDAANFTLPTGPGLGVDVDLNIVRTLQERS